MDKYKINSSGLKFLIGSEVLLNNSFYPIAAIDGKLDYLNVPSSSESILVRIKSVSDSNNNFIKVSYENCDTGTCHTISVRRNGTSVNYDEKGKYTHSFSYPRLSFIKVRVVYSDGSDTTESEFMIPNSMKRNLITGFTKLQKEVISIETSKEQYNNSDINQSATYELIYKAS